MKLLRLILFSVLFSVLFSILMASGQIAGAVDESDDVGGEVVTRAPSSVPGPRNGVSRKHYPGGGDEDDLQVQATLPIPARTFDGAAANAAIEGGAVEAAAPAATD